MPDTPQLTLTPRPPVVVRFAGLRAREGALTLGQLNIVQWIRDAPESFDTTLDALLPLPDDTRVADVADSLAALLVRHEGLRTVFELGQRQRQRVLASGAVPIEIYEVEGTGPEPPQWGALAAELERRWRPGTACGPGQLPVWLALAVRHGRVVAGCSRISHLVVDRHSLMLLGRELHEMIGDPGARQPGAPRHQPVDQAEQEDGPRLRRRVDHALEYRQELLRRMPVCPYPAPLGDAPAESVAVEMRSAAAALALRRLAARTGRSRPSVVLAAVCALLSQRTGAEDLVFPTLANNRAEQHLQGYIGTLVQTVLTRVEVGTASFDELVRRAWLAVAASSRRGMYDVDRRREIDRQVSSDRGIHFCFEPLFNSPLVDRPDDHEPPAAGPPVAVAATTLARRPMRRTLTLLRFDLHEYDDVMHLELWTGDTSRVSADAAESMLHALERLLAVAAEGDVDHEQMARTLDLPPLLPGPDLLRVDTSWVELSEMQRLLNDAFGPGRAQIFPEVGGRQLVAYVAASESVATPAQAHTDCMAALPGRHTAMAPRHYVLCQVAPDDPTDPANWRSVVSEGSGRTGTDGGVPQAPDVAQATPASMSG